jgi:hypothetical protein
MNGKIPGWLDWLKKDPPKPKKVLLKTIYAGEKVGNLSDFYFDIRNKIAAVRSKTGTDSMDSQLEFIANEGNVDVIVIFNN